MLAQNIVSGPPATVIYLIHHQTTTWRKGNGYTRKIDSLERQAMGRWDERATKQDGRHKGILTRDHSLCCRHTFLTGHGVVLTTSLRSHLPESFNRQNAKCHNPRKVPYGSLAQKFSTSVATRLSSYSRHTVSYSNQTVDGEYSIFGCISSGGVIQTMHVDGADTECINKEIKNNVI